MSAQRRTARDRRRRQLGQNFLRADLADRLIAEARIEPGELVLDFGAGAGALTFACAWHGARVLGVELDPAWAERLRAAVARGGMRGVRVVRGDALRIPLPSAPFRVVRCVPFGMATAILRKLLDDPMVPLTRADLIVQAEVARKRASSPPSTLLSTMWAPWGEFEVGRVIPAAAFRPIPRVDGAVLTVRRRLPPLLPPAMAPTFAEFIRDAWPFPQSGERSARTP